MPAAQLKGKTEPRIGTQPLRELTEDTTLGYDAIRFAENVLRIFLLEWQKWFLIHALELLPDGTLRFRTVLLLVARQNGKSTIMQVLALYRMYVDGCPLVLGTAQNLDTAEELWEAALGLADGVPQLKEEINKRSFTNGKKFFSLSSGEKWAVASATRKGARGKTKVGLALLDELREHQSWDAWSAISGTTVAEASSQILCASNAGDAQSVVLRVLRKQAIDAITSSSAEFGTDSIAIFEWSAPDDCDVWDRDAWAQANPGLGVTITERALAAAAAVAAGGEEWVFRVEHLCQWQVMRTSGPFPEGSWATLGDEGAAIAADSPLSLGIDTNWNRDRTWFVVAGYGEDGVPVVEVVAPDTAITRGGDEWAVRTAIELHEDWPIRTVVVQQRGAPGSHLIPTLTEAGLPVKPLGGSDLTASGAEAYARIQDQLLRHRHQPILDLAAENASVKAVGETWLIDRHNSPVDASPLCAAINALYGLEHYLDDDGSSAYEMYDFAEM